MLVMTSLVLTSYLGLSANAQDYGYAYGGYSSVAPDIPDPNSPRGLLGYLAKLYYFFRDIFRYIFGQA